MLFRELWLYWLDGVVVFQRYMKKEDEETKQLFDLIGRMLEYDPVERITLSEALQHPYFTTPNDLIEERQSASPHEHRNSKSRWETVYPADAFYPSLDDFYI